MTNIILQHYTGELGELELLSKANISNYAQMVDADYRLIVGNVFHPDLSPPCQKLAILNEEFDEYDNAVIVDLDMFARKGLTENVFDVPGIGVSTWFQRRLKWKNVRTFTGMVHMMGTYWGGAIWKLTRDQRQKFRAALDQVDIMKYNNKLEDEGMMHALAYKVGIRNEVMPGGDKWAHGSYMEGVENSAFIHIRPSLAQKSGKVPKIEVSHALVEQGLIDGEVK